MRLEDSKEGESIRPIGLPVVEYFERRRTDNVGTYVFPGQGEDTQGKNIARDVRGLFAVLLSAEKSLENILWNSESG